MTTSERTRALERMLIVVVSIMIAAVGALGLGIHAGLVGRNGSGSAANGGATTGYVTRAGTQLYLGDRPYVFTGINIYNATSQGNCWYDMTSGTSLQNSLQDIGSGG